MRYVVIRSALILLIFSILSVIILTEIVLYSRNTLLVHPEWISGKRLLAEPIMGSTEGFISRNILSRNRLNLQEWYGYNEILLNKIFHLGSIRFNHYIEDNGYVSIIFNKTKGSFSGIRLSRNPDFPSIFFRAKNDGKFLYKEPIPDLSIANGWNRSELAFKSDQFSLLHNGHVIKQFRESSLTEQVIGFRSGKHKTVLDDIEVNDMNGNQIIYEDFRNRQGYAESACFSTYIISGITGMLILIFITLKHSRKKIFFQVLLFQITIVFFMVLYYGFDYYLWSQKYHLNYSVKWERVAFNKQIDIFEKLRINTFNRFPFIDYHYSVNSAYVPESLLHFLGINYQTKFREIDLQIIRSDVSNRQVEIIESDSEAIQNYFKQNPFLSGTRILFLGSSQMWGSGALNRLDQIASITLDNLLTHFNNKQNIYMINASKRGTQAMELMYRYDSYLYLFEPDIVVINLSNNDVNKSFNNDLNKLVEVIHKHGSKSLFVLEANSIEDYSQELKNNHAIMINLAKNYNIPIIDLHGHLSMVNIYDSGLLWWDRVHMTSCGQKLAGDFIAHGIINYKHYWE